MWRWGLRAGGAVTVRGLGSAWQLVVAVAIGRAAGAEGLGLYFLFIAWARLFENLLSAGLPQYALRRVSRWYVTDERDASRAFVDQALLLVLLITALAWGLLELVPGELWHTLLRNPAGSHIMTMAVLGGGAFACLRVVSEALKGRNVPGFALFLEFSGPPFLMSLAAFGAVLGGIELSAPGIVTTYTVLVAVTAVAARLAWAWWCRPGSAHGRQEGIWDGARELLPVFLGFNLVNAFYASLPFLLLPLLATAEEIGMFGTAHRLVSLGSMIMAGLASWFAPRFARHSATGDRASLWRDFQLSQRLSLLCFAPLFLIFLVAGRQLLGFFGPEFPAGVLLLWILAAGQLANSGIGLVSEFLNMAGGQRMELRNTASALLLLVVATLLLGTWLGAVGVAAAYSVTIVLRKTASYVAAVRLTRGLGTSALAGAAS